jgi:hypothetical protein
VKHIHDLNEVLVLGLDRKRGTSRHDQEFGGGRLADPEGARPYLGALVLGYHDPDRTLTSVN